MTRTRYSLAGASRIKLTTEEMNEIPAYLTPSEIKRYGFLVESEPSKPIRCQFCNKELLYLGMRSLLTKTILKWKKEPERCNCKESVKYWKEVDQAKEKAELDMQEQKEQAKLMASATRLFDQSKMGKRFRSRTFESFEVNSYNSKAFESVKRYSDGFGKFADQGLGFMLSGPYGTGKTHLAAALAIDLISKGIPVVFGTLLSLLGKIKRTYVEDRGQDHELDILETYSTVDLLIIDDLGKERASDWVLEKLFSIVNTRYENNLPIVVTTNFNLETLIDKLAVNKNSDIAESIVSRLHEMCKGIYLNAPDYRKVK
ncbi:DNA replication protein [Desulfosporosinus acidiphilus SJ4]|uniref:DNA replication protein n=1 Tax=Desulfosporosinus acidiphilus (strain DSM 22704 / JCM 16185 / SJ4) TaxID=646529 RepID=I4D822_DESAJ|nr:DNA replication protein [Desulfosporosinus acidiphilus SJ4]